MNILVIGDQKNFDELQEKFGKDHQYVWLWEHRDFEGFIEHKDLVFDFAIDEDPYSIEKYSNKLVQVFFNTCRISLTELSSLAGNQQKCTLFGFNGMPTLLNRDVFEVSLLRQQDKPELKRICEQLQTEFLLVDDRVGMVTPRILSMIINEAYYTVQDGTATREDIDLAMKLGTNYPYGPFEWSQRIGLPEIYALLEAIYDDTHDERYKICPLLKKEYLNQVGQ